MGVGLPENILESISLGIDMFDCVLPTRNARHGIIYTKNGVLNMKNAKWQEDFNPIDSESTALTSKVHTRAYLRHLFKTEEMLAAQIASLQNLSFFTWLVREARIKIKDGTFFSWKTEMVRKVSQRL